MMSDMNRKSAQPAETTAGDRFAVACTMCIYFCSGTCSLIDEVVWVRLLKLTLGNTVYASSIVVSMFMAGLALGALIMSRYADRVRRHLRLYAGLELLVTVSALAMPWGLHLAGIGYRWFFLRFQPSPAGLLFLQAVISALLLLVPTILMGSTLPLLGGYVTSLEDRVGHRVGRLYALNTLGAALGCFLAGFVFIRLAGVIGTLYIAAVINLFAASGAYFLSRGHDSAPQPVEKDVGKGALRQAVTVCGPAREYILLAGFFLSGLISIGYELIWMRNIVVPLGGFTYVFSAVLTVYLVGNVIGAWIGSCIAKRAKEPGAAFGISLTFLGVLGISYIVWFRVWYRLLRTAPVITKLFTASLGLASIRNAILPLFDSTFLFLLPATAMGIGFPLALQAWARLRHRVGRTTGTVYGVNTIGAVLGGLVAGFLLIPWLGVQLSICVLGLMGIWLGAGMFLAFCASRSKSLRAGAPAVAAVLTVAVLIIPTDLFERTLEEAYKGQILALREGVTTTVAVSREPDGTLLMAIDNVQMAGDGVHRSAQKMLGHLGALLHGDPKDVLSFGFGTGETTAALAQHDLRRIDCVEIAPEVIEMGLKFFGHINLGEQLSEKVNMIYMDGKNFLNLTGRRYDIIINDSNVHSTSDSAPLFTKEHFQSALNRLQPGGLFMTKLHLQGHPRSSFDSILGTFSEVFPYATVWFPVTKPFVFFYLVGSAAPQRFSPRRIDDELSKDKVHSSAAYLNFQNSLDVLSCYIADEQDMAAYLQDYRINSDYHPYIEFNLDPQNLVLAEDFPKLLNMLRHGSVKRHIDWTGFSQQEQSQWITDYDSHYKIATLLLRGHTEKAFLSNLINCFEGLRMMPGYAPLIEMQSNCLAGVENALYGGLVGAEDIIEAMNRQIAGHPDFGAAWLVKSIALRLKKDTQAAIASGERALQYMPEIAEAHDNLALIYWGIGQIDKSATYSVTAAKLKPDDARLRFNVAEAFKAQNRLEEAIVEYRAMLRLRPGYIKARERLNELLTKTGQSAPPLDDREEEDMQ